MSEWRTLNREEFEERKTEAPLEKKETRKNRSIDSSCFYAVFLTKESLGVARLQISFRRSTDRFAFAFAFDLYAFAVYVRARVDARPNWTIDPWPMWISISQPGLNV